MSGQLRESAEQRLWPGFRRTATTDRLGPIEDGLRSIGRPGDALRRARAGRRAI
jgi:hypothetical protein